MIFLRRYYIEASLLGSKVMLELLELVCVVCNVAPAAMARAKFDTFAQSIRLTRIIKVMQTIFGNICDKGH